MKAHPFPGEGGYFVQKFELYPRETPVGMGMEEAAGTRPPQHGGGEQGRGERDPGGILPLRGKIDKLRRELLCRELRRRFLHHLLELLEGRPPGIVGKAQDGQLDLGRQSPSLRHQ